MGGVLNTNQAFTLAILLHCAVSSSNAQESDARLSEPMVVELSEAGEEWVQSAEESCIGCTEGTLETTNGPDVIVGNIYEVSSFGSTIGISAFSIGTVSCNIGDQPLSWVTNTNRHPVIGQNMFRLKDGRFEQIGQSWLKHAFLAFSEGLCFADCQPTNGTLLGVHCSDPYSATLNGAQYNLGPKYQVNASTGYFPYPPANPSYIGVTPRRLQVTHTDLNPLQNGGGQYFVEAQYVTSDDAEAGNKDNNASYAPINVFGSGSSWTIRLSGTTRRKKPGIRAWKDHDPSVVETDVQVPDDGLMIVAAKVTDLGVGKWHYEYAVQNLNSHRSAGSFSVPIDPTAALENIEFHTTRYHSGEPYIPTDWPTRRTDGRLTWYTATYLENQDANALRWGTLYNFRFDADRPPQSTTIELGLFRPGTPASVSAQTVGPLTEPADCNKNGVPDPTDIKNQTSEDCDSDSIPDECEVVIATSVSLTSGLVDPVAIAAIPEDADRLFVVERGGRVRLFNGDALLSTPFLDISDRVGSNAGQGLSGIAFAHDYFDNGYFFVQYGDPGGAVVIARYTTSEIASQADGDSELVLKRITSRNAIPSAGQLHFGPDGLLYSGLGSVAGIADEIPVAQDPASLLGKVIRLDVNRPPDYIPLANPFVGPALPVDEIWAMGLHDPRRFSFDRSTGDLYVADSGDTTVDEIDIQRAASRGGENYGWPCLEGTECTGQAGCSCSSRLLISPIHQVPRMGSDCPGLVGGLVYRGCSFPNLQGHYFFSDSCPETIYSFRTEDGLVHDIVDRTAELTPDDGPIGTIAAFGEDAAGEMYFATSNGELFKVVRDPMPQTDCGDGLLNPGEECDDGNSEEGDGCSAFCRIEPRPVNDRCARTIPIREETVTFDTHGAGSDGPDESLLCQIDDAVESDVWFCYTAGCTGTATLDFCGGTFDPIVAVYTGCNCPTTRSATVCDIGCAFEEGLTIPVSACGSYLLRVGGFLGEQRIGKLSITCDPDPIQNDCNENGVDDASELRCLTEHDNNENGVLDSCETNGDPIRGGRLYDQWWSVLGIPPPESDHPLWSSRPDVVSNSAGGAATWRCVECHGWDYQGVNGQYGTGPHRTGFRGVLGSEMNAEVIRQLLSTPPEKGKNPSGHGYGGYLNADDLNDLVAFLLSGAIGTDVLIDPISGQFQGDPVNGAADYALVGSAYQCLKCHGADGTYIDFGTKESPSYLGTVAHEDPWRFLHRTRMGTPNGAMLGWLQNEGDDQSAADIGKYVQATFPIECVSNDQCDDGITCTVDRCDSNGRCVYQPDDSTCTQDSDFCNGPEVCDPVSGCQSAGNPCSEPSACDNTAQSCGCLSPLMTAAGSRYLAILVRAARDNVPFGFAITPECDASVVRYLSVPDGPDRIARIVSDPSEAAHLTASEWGEVVFAYGVEIVPETTYQARSDCGLPNRPMFSGFAEATTFSWGDVLGLDEVVGITDPDGEVSFLDISAVVDGFRAIPEALPFRRLDLFGCVPDQTVDFLDVAGCVDAFKGLSYRRGSRCPGPCW